MIAKLVLSKALRKIIEREARAALPRECCGLIEGRREFDAVLASAVHATRNLAEEADRFAIDPAEHIRLLRRAREAGNEIWGCYHSHPNGKAEPSAHDAEQAADEFVWLIASVVGKAVELRAFVFADGAFHKVALAEKAAA